uniref:Uncharacterized protein n=1 Tax=Chromera velia CCMP2878 TaxID=1169474 RepID=A0A0G4GCT4_9ALVE|eukprot:Cvel_21345.t1-p1 / transcript=Cvel_21345.t1 / gene=Cvel_21345 / organism=Chromera_velia_CCMP2878 / gene_product=Uncharacterized protein At5g03900, chloroplastic, putative / transcript_product=Uncharacterized protein At5g03900, chloroplastic, putative / location=Cvel_scaffold1992:23015-27943(-) / protein_length=622 / sequence_SO=supercontig / SO=protein_coding / is_pseudo=false
MPTALFLSPSPLRQHFSHRGTLPSPSHKTQGGVNAARTQPLVLPCRALLTNRERATICTALQAVGGGGIFERESVLQELSLTVSQKTLRAVEKCGYVVTVSDFAAACGCDLRTSQRLLNILSPLSGATLKVSELGEILYEFPRDFRSQIANRNRSQKAREWWERTAAPFLYQALKVGVGGVTVVVLASLVVFITALFFLSASGGTDNRRQDSRGNSRGAAMSPAVYVDAFDIFRIVDMLSWDRGTRRRRRYTNRNYRYEDTVRGESGVGGGGESFLENIFSFLFGDGDPNENVEELRLKAVAQVVRQNGGAVTAEQLAPFMDPPTNPGTETENGTVDESFMMPVLIALDGRPEVTDEGGIVYTFPSLMMTGEGEEPQARNSRRRVWSPQVLLETEIPFSETDAGSQAVSAFIVGGTLLLTGVLGWQLAGIPIALPGVWGLAQRLYPALASYALVLNAIPFVRWRLNKSKNAEIRSRNDKRQRWSAYLKSGSAYVRNKLGQARRFAQRLTRLKDQEVIYDSSISIEKQEMDRELAEFDRQLEGLPPILPHAAQSSADHPSRTERERDLVTNSSDSPAAAAANVAVEIPKRKRELIRAQGERETQSQIAKDAMRWLEDIQDDIS